MNILSSCSSSISIRWTSITPTENSYVCSVVTVLSSSSYYLRFVFCWFNFCFSLCCLCCCGVSVCVSSIRISAVTSVVFRHSNPSPTLSLLLFLLPVVPRICTLFCLPWGWSVVSVGVVSEICELLTTSGMSSCGSCSSLSFRQLLSVFPFSCSSMLGYYSCLCCCHAIESSTRT